MVYGYDDSTFRKLKIYLKPEAGDPVNYMTTNAWAINDHLRVEPTKIMDNEVKVKLFWTSFDTPAANILSVLLEFGDTTGTLEHMKFGRNKKGNADGLADIFTGNRVVSMKVMKNIPSYIVIDGKKVKCIYPGQIKTCARCHKTSDICVGMADAGKCDELGGEKRDLLENWELIKKEAKKVYIGYSINADYIELSGFPPSIARDDIVAYLSNEGFEIEAEKITQYESKGTWRIQGIDDDTARSMIIDLAGKSIDRKNKIKVVGICGTPEKTQKEKLDHEFWERKKKETEEKRQKEREEKEKKEKEEKEKKEKDEKKKKKEEKERKKKEKEEKEKNKNKKGKKDDKDEEGGGSAGGSGGGKGGGTSDKNDKKDDNSEEEDESTDDDTFIEENDNKSASTEPLEPRTDPEGMVTLSDDEASMDFASGVRRTSTPDPEDDPNCTKIRLRKTEDDNYKIKTPAIKPASSQNVLKRGRQQAALSPEEFLSSPNIRLRSRSKRSRQKYVNSDDEHDFVPERPKTKIKN